MARAFPVTPPNDFGAEPPPGEWQALRGELVALLDQVEGQYARTGSADPALAGFAQRMRDLRYQVADVGSDDRHREALRSVKRQIDRFNDRGEQEPMPMPHSDNVLQSAIQQIRARTGGEMPRPMAPQMASMPQMAMPQMPQAAPPPRFDEMARSMAGLSSRLEQLEAELRAQRGNAVHVKEIADQVSQLSHVVELVAGAVGETGQVKRLEGQIAGLAQMIAQTPRVDLGQLTERLDGVAATVDRLADLQVQQVEHAVREAAEVPQKDAETAQAMRSVEASVRTIYDRLDALEQSMGVPQADLDRITGALAQITARLGSDNARPDTLLGLVDALNGRINELEMRTDAVHGLKGDLDGLRTAVLGAMDPRFSAIETTLGALGEKLSEAPVIGEVPGVAQLEAQVRQLVARMDQTGEQLRELYQLYGTPQPQPDFEALANLAASRSFEAMQRQQAASPPPDFEALANLAATRSAEAVQRNQPAPLPVPDYEGLADLAAARSLEAVQRNQPEPAPAPDFEALAHAAASKAIAAIPAPEPDTRPMVSEASLASFESRMTRLVESITKTRGPEAAATMQDGLGRLEDRLMQLEAALGRRDAAHLAALQSAVAAPRATAPAAAPAAAAPAAIAAAPIIAEAVIPAAPAERLPRAEAQDSVPDSMPRNPGADAPLKEFGFPDLGPVRAALEAKSGPRKVHPGMDKIDDEPRYETQPLTPEMAGGVAREKSPAIGNVAPPTAFDPASIPRPPRPPSSLDAEATFTPAMPQPAAPSTATNDQLASSRNTFIEAARRAAQRQAPQKPEPDSNSLIGKALARFQPGTNTGKPAAPVAKAPVMPEPVPLQADAAKPEGDKPASRVGKLLSRQPKAKAEPAPRTPEPVPAAATVMPEQREAPTESFLLRHRKAILLTASLVAVSFMALNLVLQRLAANETPSAASVASAVPAAAPAMSADSPAKVTAPSTPAAMTPAPSSTAPAAAPVTAAPADGKPVSSLSTPEAGSPVVEDTASAATPRIVPMTDPVVTASTSPAMSFAPTAVDAAAMPPALAAANTAAAAVGPAADADGTSPVALASLSTTPAAVAPAGADTAVATPTQLDSPVKVEMPPTGLGPEDLRQAAADGDARAQFEIAAIYSEGRAVTQDFKQAAVWYERAAAQGFGPAQYRLGNLYENGKGVDKDLEQARLWYQRSAEAGNRMAMHNLAALYAGGQFGKQDFASAAEWFERAANLGMKDSQFNLGMLYARGLGVPANLETSYKWFALAGAGGDADSLKARDNVARSLDAEAVKRATAAVAAFKLQPVNLAANFAPIGTWEKNFNPGQAVTQKDVVTKVQQALARLGFDVGTPDGHAGPKTTDAIKSFEHSTGMSEVGQINPRLLAVLGSQPA